MKSLILPALVLLVAVGCRPLTDGAVAQDAVPPAPPAGSTAAPSAGAPSAPAAELPPPPVAGTVIAAPVPAPIPDDLPEPVADVVRLAQSAVEPAVVQSFAENLEGGFPLTADHIIYLADVGVSTAVIQVLIAKSAVRPPVPAPAVQPAPAVVAGAAPTATLSPVEAPPPVYGEAQAGAPPAPQAQAAPAPVAAPVQNVTYNVFHESLSPYGSWVQVSGYGWCWRPTVAVINTGWRPYCDDGWWVWSDYGWYWHSTYSWGWAPFHYGRWCQAPGFGWVWSPGTTWGPAWVAWRSTDAYCGWAPLPPECGWSSSIGFTWARSGVSVGIGFGIGAEWWVTTGWSNFTHRRLRSVCLPPRDGHRALGRSEINVGRGNVVNVVGDNNTVIINDGVSRDAVQRHVRSEIPKVAVTDAPSPGAGGARLQPGSARRPEIAVYRPRLDVAGRDDAQRALPASRPGVGQTPGASPSSGLVPSRGGVVPAPRPSVGTVPSRGGGKPGETIQRPAAGSAVAPRPGPATTPGGVRPAVPTRPTPSTGGGVVPGRIVPTVPARPQSGSPARPAVVPNTPAPRREVTPGPARPAVPPSSSLRSAPGADFGRIPPAVAPSRGEVVKPALPRAPQPSVGGGISGYGSPSDVRSRAGVPSAGTVNRPGFPSPGGVAPSRGFPSVGAPVAPSRPVQAAPSAPRVSQPAARPSVSPGAGSARPQAPTSKAPAREPR